MYFNMVENTWTNFEIIFSICSILVNIITYDHSPWDTWRLLCVSWTKLRAVTAAAAKQQQEMMADSQKAIQPMWLGARQTEHTLRATRLRTEERLPAGPSIASVERAFVCAGSRSLAAEGEASREGEADGANVRQSTSAANKICNNKKIQSVCTHTEYE